MEEAKIMSPSKFKQDIGQSYAGNFLLVSFVTLLLVGATWLTDPEVFHINSFGSRVQEVSAEVLAGNNSTGSLGQTNNVGVSDVNQVALQDPNFYQNFYQIIVSSVESGIQALGNGSSDSQNQQLSGATLAAVNIQTISQPQVAGDFISNAPVSLRGPVEINLRGP